MRYCYFFISLGVFLIGNLQAQNPFGANVDRQKIKLYVSKQTGEHTSVVGEYTKIADQFEKGSCTLSTSGPVTYVLNPQPVYEPNSKTTWKGLAKPDSLNCPDPGTSMDASIKGNYDVYFSKPGLHVGERRSCDAYYTDAQGVVHDPHGCGGTHTIVNNKGNEKVKYEIVSILLDLPDTFYSENLEVRLQASTVFPGPGTIVWETPAGTLTGNPVSFNYFDSTVHDECGRFMRHFPHWERILQAANSCPSNLGKCFSVSAKYTIEGVSYSDQANIRLVKVDLYEPRPRNQRISTSIFHFLNRCINYIGPQNEGPHICPSVGGVRS